MKCCKREKNPKLKYEASRANYLVKISRRWIIQFLQDRELHFSISLYLILVSQIGKKLIT